MTGTMAYIITVCFARRHELLSTSMHHIAPSIALACAPKVPSRTEWEDLLEVGIMLCNIIRSLKEKKEGAEIPQELEQDAIYNCQEIRLAP